MSISEDGKSVKVTKQRLIVKQLTNKAIKGDLRAAQKTLAMALSLLDTEDDQSRAAEPLSESDEAILNAYIARLQGQTDDE